jgi:hypothetical protein
MHEHHRFHPTAVIPAVRPVGWRDDAANSDPHPIVWLKRSRVMKK